MILKKIRGGKLDIKAELLKLRDKIDFSSVVTVGNHSFISLNLANTIPEDMIEGILHILDRFEKVRGLINGWFLEKRIIEINHARSYRGGTDIVGIWVNHRAK